MSEHWPFPPPALSREERRKIIGASDAPIIMMDSPWNTPYELWQEKMGLSGGKRMTGPMIRGIRLEAEAREAFCHLKGIDMEPRVVYHPSIPWMVASLDGMSAEGDAILEIKCGGGWDHGEALKGRVSEKYMWQLQHQLAVTGLPEVWYFSWFPAKPDLRLACLRIPRDEKKIEDLMAKEAIFWEHMQTKKHPPLSERDLIRIEKARHTNGHC